MAIYLVVCMIWLKLSIAFASLFRNESCFDGATIVLSFGLYQNSCPEAEPIIFSWVEKRLPKTQEWLLLCCDSIFTIASLMQAGCDASVLLDDTQNFVGEKTAAPNLNSLRGFEVIDAIKADLEYVCPQIVSCADILAVAARDSVVLSGGPGWEVQLGRKDSLSASKTAANNNIPGPNSDVPTLASKFQNVGLSLQDMVALSGAHTMGKARCSTFSSRINGNDNTDSPDINLEFLQSLQQLCSQSNSNTTLADLDHMTPSMFDNQYYVNILSGEGLLASDQVLATGNDRTREIIQTYVDDPSAFYEDFKYSMLKMGSLASVSGGGEIRRNCRVSN